MGQLSGFPSLLSSVAALLILAFSGGPARSEHASIDLRLYRTDPETGVIKDDANAFADEEPPLGGVNPRPLFKARVNDPLVLQFTFTNTYPHGETKGVTISYFVVRQ